MKTCYLERRLNPIKRIINKKIILLIIFQHFYRKRFSRYAKSLSFIKFIGFYFLQRTCILSRLPFSRENFSDGKKKIVSLRLFCAKDSTGLLLHFPGGFAHPVSFSRRIAWRFGGRLSVLAGRRSYRFLSLAENRRFYRLLQDSLSVFRSSRRATRRDERRAAS